MQKILITGGAGFIGSAVIRRMITQGKADILNIDKLTYASNLESLANIAQDPRYSFEKIDICDAAALNTIFDKYQPDAVMHLAAETHVDRSIDNADAFIQTNILGTYTLLEATRRYWYSLDNSHQHEKNRQQQFRFHHISTDEVYGDLKIHESAFTETTAYAPSSPYSASKASADHLVRAWHKTYGLPVIITNCSNNYGAYQFPEKLIPLTILNALDGKPLPVYGNGQQVRDWLYVDDHAAALYTVLTMGKIGETYNIGGNHVQTNSEQKNIDVVTHICELLDELTPPATRALPISTYKELITFVEDRPGHDQRYAIDTTKIQQQLGWQPTETFASGLRKTVQWYLANRLWAKKIQATHYQQQRLGLGSKHNTGNTDKGAQ